MKLTPPPVNTRDNTVLPLRLLVLSLLFSVFMRASFLQNTKKTGTFFADCTWYKMYVNMGQTLESFFNGC